MKLEIVWGRLGMNFKDMTNCSYIPLPEVLSFIVDNRGKTVPTVETGIPLIATNCIKNNELYPVYEKIRYLSDDTYKTWFRAHPIPGDIIFVNKGSPGTVCLVPDPVGFCIAQDMMAFRVNSKIINNKYLFAVLRSPQFQTQIEQFHVGTLIPHFKKGDLNKLLIPIPDMKIQKYIGEMYFDLCNKIELNNRINKTLEEMAQAIFKSWFVDFDPFQDGEFVDSELGRIPKGWKVGILGEVATITSGKRPLEKQDTCSEDMIIPVVGASSIMAYTKEALYDEKILITGRVGTHGIIQRFNSPCWASDNTLVIKSEKYEFVYQILNHIDFKSMNRGSTQPLITQTDLKNVRIIIPSNNIIEDYERIVSNLMDMVQENNSQKIKLSLIRDSLLPKLMNGEIRVPVEGGKKNDFLV